MNTRQEPQEIDPAVAIDEQPGVIRSSRVREGWPFPLGATWDGLGVNFALFSAHATRVELCLFDASGTHEVERIELPEYTDEVWHGYLPDARPGQLYAYRVHGPYEPESGHRFNPHKLLLDPYAKQLVGELVWDEALFGYTIGHADGDLSFDTRDSAPFMPRCRVIDPAFTWGRSRGVQQPWERTVVYETHVRGYTMRHPAVPEALRGTFSGLMVNEVVDYIRSLGVSSVELLPIHAFVDDQHLLERGLRNYWGYSTLGFFAPHSRYLSGSNINEFKQMVACYHAADLEVILDVVYNHTAEGNHLGPTLSFKGIDNASYYRLLPDEPRYYIDDTGTGNTLNLSHPRVLQMVTDSLRYWATEMRVDGFRFDLATILGREPHGFDEGGGFLDSCRQDPVLSQVKLIAEPWDCGPGGYQVGGFPPGWAEWNDRFRDTSRAFWRGDEGQLAEFASRLMGSADLFDRRGRRPFASVNFVTAHDGFTLHDLVAYDDKHNQANGEENRDGHDHNLSWNHGEEGPTDDPDVHSLRLRQIRNFLATLLFSQGTPMLLAGDELLRTQRGNNNAYCQDNELSWLDWNLEGDAHDLIDYLRRLIALRLRYPILRRGRFLSGEYNEEMGLREVTWLAADGSEMDVQRWEDPQARCLGLLLDGRARPSGIRRAGDDRSLLILFNASPEPIAFCLPDVPRGNGWVCRLDTRDSTPPDAGLRAFGEEYAMLGRSLVMLELEQAP
ncbi:MULTISPECIES: glycogen debranching protein GlgX [Halomonadaceae]|uniref:Glycogen debranching protein GlgX n=1 Tax=Billgrantia aerodenitrificans TaxID=2733483 RepID=A0ABS9AR95_9GAMM|nr:MULTISPECIES: glycogen debranching protein GlgX [Halomonas]MCE8024213.1 glycogen debranching protein GlgX [Halomonas aerodenitrificans]